MNWAATAPGLRGTWHNPFAFLNQSYRSPTSNLVGNGAVSYTILPGLDLKVTLGYTTTETNEVMTIPSTNYDPAISSIIRQNAATSVFNTSNAHTWIVEPQVNYHVNVGRQGILSALVGTTFQENYSGFRDC